MTTVDFAQAASALEKERDTVLHQLGELGADEHGEFTGEMDFGGAFADAGAATAERTETMGLIENLKLHLDDVKAAIARIDEGTYGVCAACGKDIGTARLEYRPTSIKCVDCKAQTG